MTLLPLLSDLRSRRPGGLHGCPARPAVRRGRRGPLPPLPRGRTLFLPYRSARGRRPAHRRPVSCCARARPSPARASGSRDFAPRGIGWTAYAGARGLGDSRAGNLLKAIAAARTFSMEGLDFGSVVAELERLTNAGYIEEMSARPGRRGAVRLMTVTGERLEAPVVFLADPRRENDPPVRFSIDRRGPQARDTGGSSEGPRRGSASSSSANPATGTHWRKPRASSTRPKRSGSSTSLRRARRTCWSSAPGSRARARTRRAPGAFWRPSSPKRSRSRARRPGAPRRRSGTSRPTSRPSARSASAAAPPQRARPTASSPSPTSRTLPARSPRGNRPAAACPGGACSTARSKRRCATRSSTSRSMPRIFWPPRSGPRPISPTS